MERSRLSVHSSGSFGSLILLTLQGVIDILLIAAASPRQSSCVRSVESLQLPSCVKRPIPPAVQRCSPCMWPARPVASRDTTGHPGPGLAHQMADTNAPRCSRSDHNMITSHVSGMSIEAESWRASQHSGHASEEEETFGESSDCQQIMSDRRRSCTMRVRLWTSPWAAGTGPAADYRCYLDVL